MKKFIVGLVSGILLMSGTLAFAESTQSIEAIFGRVKLVVDGKAVDKETLLYNGTTYVPLRAAAEALGKDVSYDGETQTAYIGGAGREQATAPVQQGNYSRSNPAPLNTVQTITVESIMGNHTVNIRVVEATRGDEAWSKIYEANRFNSSPEEGYEFILAKIAVSALSIDNDAAISLGAYSFDCYSSNDTKYDSASVVEPEPELSSQIYVGGNTEGYVAFCVKKDDPAPKIAYGLKYDGSGGGWFTLQ